MGKTGYVSNTCTVGNVSDRFLAKPAGSGTIEVTPPIPAAFARTNADAGDAPYYTKTSTTVLHLTLANPPGFTTGSKIAVFWNTAGVDHFLLNCTITSITGAVVVITAPGSVPSGQSDFTTVTAGTTVCTFSLATILTADEPQNPDLTAYTIDPSVISQFLFTAGLTGAVELISSGAGVFYWNYASTGDFFNWVEGEAAPWTGVIDTIRFYSSAMKTQTMSVAALVS